MDWDAEQPHEKKEPELHLVPHTQTNSKWIKDLSVTIKIVKLLEESMSS